MVAVDCWCTSNGKMDEWTNQYEFPWKTNGTQLLKICDEKENKN